MQTKESVKTINYQIRNNHYKKKYLYNTIYIIKLYIIKIRLLWITRI